MDKDNMLFGQLNQEIELLEYTGKKTDTANVTVDNTEQTISVDVLKLPNTLTIKENKEHRENIVSHTFDGSRDVEVDLTGYATDAETQEKLDTKRDKIVRSETQDPQYTLVYSQNTNGVETSIPVDKSAVANAIAWRNANANLVGNDATANNEYTPLSQVEQFLDKKRDIVPIPAKGTRFYTANSSNGQSYTEGSTGANKKFDVVQRFDNAQIKAPNQAIFPPLDDEYISKSYADNNYLKKTGGNITGSLSLTQDLTVGGNLTVNGTTTTVESTTLQVKDKLIEVAHGNTLPLTTPAGIVAPNYNGNDSGAMVFDNTGTAYVGDVTLDASGNIDVEKSHLQPLATRNLSSANDGQLVKWDETNKTLVASTESLSDKLDKLTPTNTSMLYGITPEGQNIGFSTGTDNIDEYAIPQRTVNGQIAMPNQVTYAPTDDQAISKRFADNNYEKLRTPLFTGEFLYEISKSTTGTIQRSLHGYGVTAKPSSIVKRTTKGQIELPDQTASAPTDDQAISKGYADANYLKGALPTVGTSTSSKDLKKIVYTAESDIPATPEEGVEYACTDLIGEEDLAPSFVNKVNGKQGLLTFDTTPTVNSTNPVTSGGIYDAISQFITIQVSDSLMGG